MSKTFLFILLLIVAFSQGFTQSNEVNIPFENPSSEKQLKIEIFQGDISIKASNRNDISVKYTIEEGESDEDTGQEHEGLRKISGTNLDLEMSCENNKAKISSHNWNKNLRFEIEVPKNIHLNIHKNIGGDISVESVVGNVNIENNVGNIVTNMIAGIVNASTNAGDLKIHFAEIPESKNMMFSSTTGSIDLTLPAAHKTTLKMKTEMGEIYSDLEIDVQQKNNAVEESNEGKHFRYFNNSWTHGTLNGGGDEITIRTKMGNVYLRGNK